VIALVTGGRAYADRGRVFHHLDAFDPAGIIEGGAVGADRFAREWAIERQRPYATVPAHWDTLGRAAGQIRNGWMLLFRPDVLLAFPGGRGTAGMVRRAMAAGLRIEHCT
jgi:hypothetical protein